MRQCSKCKVKADVSQFRLAQNKYHSYCRECERTYNTARAKLQRLANKSRLEVLIPEVKRCPGCRTVKPYIEFGRNLGNKDSLAPYCRPCQAKESAAKRSMFRQDDIVRYKLYRIFHNAKARAKVQKCAFDITLEMLIQHFYTTTHCPALGLKLDWNSEKVNAASPTLDKIIPTLGYVLDNICIISHRANQLKNDIQPDEILKFYDWLTSVIQNDK